MKSIYDRRGFPVAWLNKNNIYDKKGYFIGFLQGQAVYNYKTEYCGTLQNSFFRDSKGNVVAFLIDAKKGLVLPTLKPSSMKPVLKPPLINKIPPPPKVAPTPKYSWSIIRWEKFLIFF